MKKKHFGDGYECRIAVMETNSDGFVYEHWIARKRSIRAAIRYVRKRYPHCEYRVRSLFCGIPDIKNFSKPLDKIATL